jgi:hypothetical protein
MTKKLTFFVRLLYSQPLATNYWPLYKSNRSHTVSAYESTRKKVLSLYTEPSQLATNI